MFFYYKENNEMIEKYQVKFDEEKISKLADEIIDNCSYISHKHFQSGPYFWDEPNKKLIRNLKYKTIGTYYDRDEEAHYILEYDFDEYKPPELVRLIYGLLNNKYEYLEKIYNYDLSSELSLQEKIDGMCEEISHTQDNKEKIKKMGKMKEMILDIELNEKQKPLDDYYKRLISLIDISLVNICKLEDINRVLNFLEIKSCNKSFIYEKKK